jgi:hypothetical protein
MKIHGHPQKTDYNADGSDYPRHEAQGWWNQFDPVEAGHLHVGVTYPSYGEITILEPFWVTFTLKLHDIVGEVKQFFGPHIRELIWNDTGTSTPPVMRGTDPGLPEWSGKILIDYMLGQQPWLGDIGMTPMHGWMGSLFTARVLFDTFDLLEVQQVESHFMLIDNSIPERPASQQGRPGVVTGSRVTVSNQGTSDGSTLKGNRFGAMVTEINDYLPLLPITAPWPTIVNVYNYTAEMPLPDGIFRQLLDADLHHGGEGTLIDIAHADVRGVSKTIVFDPLVMGSGKHRGIVNWTQTSKEETLVSTLAFDLPVDVGVPIPTICNDRNALNFGGLLPCRYQVDPPPVPVTVIVPELVGMTHATATAALKALELGETVTLDQTETVTEQSPVGGTTVNKGSLVKLIVS